MKFDPDYVVHPGATLSEWMEENNVSLSELVKQSTLEEWKIERILVGALPINQIRAANLQQGTGISAAYWLAADRNFREGLAAGKHWNYEGRTDG